MRRAFLVVGHKAVTGPEFNLKDIPGTGGRLDVLLRCVNSAFFLSHGFRRDTTVYLVLQGEPEPPKTLRLEGDALRHLNPDERTTATLFQKALALPLAGDAWRESTPGFHVARRGLGDLEKELEGYQVHLLDEGGEDVEGAKLGEAPLFVLSDHVDLTGAERATIAGWGARPVSLGPRSYHADHCITVAHWVLDRRAGAAGAPTGDGA